MEEKLLQGVKYLFCDQCVTVGLCFEGRYEQPWYKYFFENVSNKGEK